VITKWDDYLIHQVAEPIIRPAVSVPNWMDRFYWNAQDREGRFAIGLGFGQYRVTSRMDAIAYVLLPGEERLLRLARHTTADDFADPTIGPMTFTVIEPLAQWRWEMAPNATGVSWDLTFDATRGPVEFAPFEFGEDRDASKFCHFVQLGSMVGQVTIDGTTIDIDDGLGLRDRSWGVRRSKERQGLHLWLHHRIDDRDVFLIFNEARDGSVAYCDGAVVDPTGVHRILSVGHDLEFVGSTLDVCGGTVSLLDDGGHVHTLEYERVLPGYVGGVGYGGWAGSDLPDGLEEAERIDLSGATEDILAAQPILLFDHVCRVRLQDSDWTIGSFQMGISRSRQYEYRPRSLERARS
jgi:hypothetical protein